MDLGFSRIFQYQNVSLLYPFSLLNSTIEHWFVCCICICFRIQVNYQGPNDHVFDAGSFRCVTEEVVTNSAQEVFVLCHGAGLTHGDAGFACVKEVTRLWNSLLVLASFSFGSFHSPINYVVIGPRFIQMQSAEYRFHTSALTYPLPAVLGLGRWTQTLNRV